MASTLVPTITPDTVLHSALASTTWTLPFGAGDTGYEADKAYYIQSFGTTKKHHPADLAIEVVVSHSEKKALRAGAFLKIPQLWVLDLRRHRLTFYHLVVRGKQKGTYRPGPRSRAFPFLTSAEVLERLDDPEISDTALHENCRAWVREVLVPRLRMRERARQDMPRKKKNRRAKQPGPMRSGFSPDIPTHDFLEGRSLDNMWNLQEAVANFVSWLEHDRFVTWEAVVREEAGMALTPGQKKALASLLNFNDEEDDQVLYIDEIPRPSELWHVILNRIVPHLLIEPYFTFGSLAEVKCDGWNQIVTALKAHGEGLSLPEGVKSAEEVVPAELRHKLRLQFCFDDLGGLGQDDSLTLEDPEEHNRIELFIVHLRECKDSVAYFALTLDSLLTRVILPEKDKPVFLQLMQEKLGLGSSREPIVDRL